MERPPQCRWLTGDTFRRRQPRAPQVDWISTAPVHPIVVEATAAFPPLPGGLVRQRRMSPVRRPRRDIPVPSPRRSSWRHRIPRPRARVARPGRQPSPARRPRHPAATGVTSGLPAPSLAGTTAFWLQPNPTGRAGRRAPFPSTPACTTQVRACDRLPSPPRRAARPRIRLPPGSPSRLRLPRPTAFWLQPANPVPGPGTVPFNSGLYYAGESRATASRRHRRRAAPPRIRLPPAATVHCSFVGRTKPSAVQALQPRR